MHDISKTTSAVIARAVLDQAHRKAFGVLVQDLPEYEPAALLEGLANNARGIRLRVAMPGFSPQVTRELKDIARSAGLDGEHFVTSVEGAERWRNKATVTDTIVVVAPKEIPKLNSLKRFTTLRSDDIYRQVCREGAQEFGVNSAQRELWAALERKTVSKAIPLDLLLRYFTHLATCEEKQIPLESRNNLHLLGLLPDPGLFTSPTAPKIAARLLENQRVVDQLEVLSRSDRQRIAKTLAAKADTPRGMQLQEIYKKVMAFYREQDPNKLADLTLEDALALLHTKLEAPPPPPPDPNNPNPPDPTPPPTDRKATEPTVRMFDFLVDENEEGLAQLGEIVDRVIDGASQEDEPDTRDPETGVALVVTKKHPFLGIIERLVSTKFWGGKVIGAGDTLDEAIGLIDKAQLQPFDPASPDWNIRGTLEQLIAAIQADNSLLTSFDEFVACRVKLAPKVQALLLEPAVQINRTPEVYQTAIRYLDAYTSLISGIKQAYESISALAPEGVELLCSQILALDTIVLKTNKGFKATLSPLHPLHLWKYIELSQQVRTQASALSQNELSLLRDRVDELPNFVTTLYLSHFITSEGPKVLPESGVREGLPYFEELAFQYSGRDGVQELTRLLDKFGVLYPHARLGLRLVLIDPPDVEYLLKEIVKHADSSPSALEGVHVRLFFTRKASADIAALGGGAEDEEGAERFRGAGAGSQFTLEVNDQEQTIDRIAEELLRHPAHIAVYFDPSSAKTQRFPRSPSLTVHPLCLPMQFSYDVITHAVRVVPAADGGVFSDHNDLRNRLSHQLANTYFGVTAELRAQQQSLETLAKGCCWFVVADRAQEGTLSINVPRVSLKRSGKRDIAVYSRDDDKFVTEFDRQLRKCNYTPSKLAVKRMIRDLGGLLSDGLLALVSHGAAGALDERRTQGLVGTLVTSAWYRERHSKSLLVSIDSPEARRWLELRDDATRADLFGIVDQEDGSCTLDIIEVKTYSDPEDAYRVSGTEISGEAVEQLLNTSRVLNEIFQLDEQAQRLVAPQRREVLRQHLFRECFLEGRSASEKQHWSKRLNEVFGLETKLSLRMSLVVVGLTQSRASNERLLKSQGREIRLVELTEEEIRRQLSEQVKPLRPNGSNGPPGGGGSPQALPNPSSPFAASTAPPAATDAEGPPATTEPTPAPPAAATSVAPAAPTLPTSTPPAVQPATAALQPDGEETALIERQAGDLRRILREHGFQVQELDPDKAQLGPSVIRYRVRFKAGTQVSKLRTRAEDIGRELASKTTPFIDNITGENYVGIDLERPKRRMMALSDAIAQLANPVDLQLPIAVGVTPSGEHIHLDIVQLPHLLVAGSTNSGKTVFLHSVLLSLIAKLPPSHLEFLIVDPKATDFVLYNGLPYLRGGKVITEPEEAIEALQLLTNDELRRRTSLLQQARVPNVSEYNQANPLAQIKPIVVVIDEYADLIAVLSKKDRQDFEREINRLAQRARSVGIHLILATQRPTADIVTGLLKANMPSRISFRLPQRVDSQTILDQTGAENLFGKGDMLLLMNDRLLRLQGYYMAPTQMMVYLTERFPGSGNAPTLPVEAPLDLRIDDSDQANFEDLVGEVTGLAVGADEHRLDAGSTMTIEVIRKKGEGIEVTGLSGEILNHSVLAAWRHTQEFAAQYGISPAKLRGYGVSVHLVHISEYREGPSAGLPFVIAMVSALTGRPVKRNLAVTGEVSLKGKVGSVGGVAQKLIAAFKRGRSLVILPSENSDSLRMVPPEVLQRLEVRFVSEVRDAIEAALI